MKVFISHSSVDKKFVRVLKEALNENGIATWVDEDELNFGDKLLNSLIKALDDSSHIVIILSPESVNSNWVKLELKKALENQRTGLIQKIIPIMYRKCKMPNELSELIYGDLSDEVVLPIENSTKIKFISDGFEKVFLGTVRAIRNASKKINSDEKKEIINSIKSSEQIITDELKNIHRGIHQVIGFNSKESRFKYQDEIFKENKKTIIEDIRPVLLPVSLKSKSDFKLGDIIRFENNMFSSYGYFAGYRNDDLKVVMDSRIREELVMNVKEYFFTEIDIDKKLIRFSNIGGKAGENNYSLAA